MLKASGHSGLLEEDEPPTRIPMLRGRYVYCFTTILESFFVLNSIFRMYRFPDDLGACTGHRDRRGTQPDKIYGNGSEF